MQKHLKSVKDKNNSFWHFSKAKSLLKEVGKNVLGSLSIAIGTAKSKGESGCRHLVFWLAGWKLSQKLNLSLFLDGTILNLLPWFFLKEAILLKATHGGILCESFLLFWFRSLRYYKFSIIASQMFSLNCFPQNYYQLLLTANQTE